VHDPSHGINGVDALKDVSVLEAACNDEGDFHIRLVMQVPQIKPMAFWYDFVTNMPERCPLKY